MLLVSYIAIVIITAGLLFVFGREPRQVAPVVQKGHKTAEIVDFGEFRRK